MSLIKHILTESQSLTPHVQRVVREKLSNSETLSNQEIKLIANTIIDRSGHSADDLENEQLLGQLIGRIEMNLEQVRQLKQTSEVGVFRLLTLASVRELNEDEFGIHWTSDPYVIQDENFWESIDLRGNLTKVGYVLVGVVPSSKIKVVPSALARFIYPDEVEVTFDGIRGSFKSLYVMRYRDFDPEEDPDDDQILRTII